jgi:hypothetical protein
MIPTNNFSIPVQEQEKLRVLDLDSPHARAELALEGRKGVIHASVEVLEVQAPWKAPHPLEHWQDAVLANLDALVGSFTGEPLEAQTSIHAFGNQWDPSPTAQHLARCYLFRLAIQGPAKVEDVDTEALVREVKRRGKK